MVTSTEASLIIPPHVPEMPIEPDPNVDSFPISDVDAVGNPWICNKKRKGVIECPEIKNP
jgi:hypothetical protein